METCKVSRDFSKKRFSDSELSLKAGHVIEKMRNNPYFVAPQPDLDSLSTANENYVAALLQTGNGSKMNTVIKRNLRTVVETLLGRLSDYVQQTSNGATHVVLSSGFDIHKKKGSVGELDQATGLSVNVGANRGSLIVSCSVVDRARFYEFQYTDAPATADSVWMKETSTRRKILIEGLTSGKQYVFRAAGAGSDRSRCWSDEVKSFVL